MTYVLPDRNSNGVKWEDMRLRSDHAWCEMHDQFCQKYYESWQYGQSEPWGPFDTVGDPAGDLRQFTLMQVMLVDMGTIMFHKINHRANQVGDSGVVPQDDYRYEYVRDEQGNVIETIDLVQNAHDRLADTMRELGTVSAKQMMDHYRKRIKELNGPDYDFPNWDVP